MVRLLSIAAPRRVVMSSRETATKWRTGRRRPGRLKPPKTLGLFAQAQVERCKIRAFNLKDLVLMNGCPCCAYIGFTSNYREEMEFPVTAILGNLGNAAVQPQPNAHRSVLHCPRELKPSEPFMRVL